jgi:hypothetical protein
MMGLLLGFVKLFAAELHVSSLGLIWGPEKMKHSGRDLLRRSIGGDVFFAIAAAPDGFLR